MINGQRICVVMPRAFSRRVLEALPLGAGLGVLARNASVEEAPPRRVA